MYQRPVSDAVSRSGAGGRPGSRSCASNVCAVSMKILDRLADECLTDDRAANKIRVAQVKPSVEYGQLDAEAASRARRHPAGDQPPGCAQHPRLYCRSRTRPTTHTHTHAAG